MKCNLDKINSFFKDPNFPEDIKEFVSEIFKELFKEDTNVYDAKLLFFGLGFFKTEENEADDFDEELIIGII